MVGKARSLHQDPGDRSAVLMGVFALLVVSIAITLLGYAVVDLIGELVHRGGDGGVEEGEGSDS